MTGVVLAEDDLLRRGQVIQRLMRPLVRGGGGGMKAHRLPSGANGTLLCIGSGKGDALPRSGTLRGVRYPSRIEGVTLNYSEKWIQPAGSSDYEMEHSNLHLDIARPAGSQGSEEVLALHCEPRVQNGVPSSLYKKGPHLHLLLSGAARALSKSHIALCLTEAGHRCSTTHDFTVALKAIIGMINHEVLPCLGPG